MMSNKAEDNRKAFLTPIDQKDKKMVVACSVCTYENTLLSAVCAMCELPLPTTRIVSNERQHHKHVNANKDPLQSLLSDQSLDNNGSLAEVAKAIASIKTSQEDELLALWLAQEEEEGRLVDYPHEQQSTLDADLAAVMQQEERAQSFRKKVFSNARLEGATAQKEDIPKPDLPEEGTKQSADAQLAAAIQREQDVQRQADESCAMLTSHAGRAFRFVQDLISLYHELLVHDDGSATRLRLETVAADDIVFLAEAFIECQELFHAKGKPCEVTVGYHYTKSSNMESIREEGLMSQTERAARSIRCSRGAIGSSFGDGIYIATNPEAFRNYGDVGLLVAIVKGNEMDVLGPPDIEDPNIDTFVGNKVTRRRLQQEETPNAGTFKDPYNDEIVLRQSMQCLPLFSFTRTSIHGDEEDCIDTDKLWEYHKALQHLLDIFFNNGKQVEVDVIETTGRGLHRLIPKKPIEAETVTHPPGVGQTQQGWEK